MDTNNVMNFNFPTDPAKIIKVIGVGGGGVNSVNYMYECGIHGVNFAVCNTDAQSFKNVNVPVKVVLGSGLGAGGEPEIGKKEFEKSEVEVENLLNDGTKMIFIAAGLGGGTGSGAGPMLAKMAKEKGILTVGIVTIPFEFELIPRIIKALDAVEEMNRNVDALIVINNERLATFYPDFDIDEAFKKPDEVLAMAVKSIAEIITVKGVINRDFNDVTTTMKNSGIALVSYGFGSGENRLDNAIQEALDSPLLNNNDVYNAKRILIYISFRKDSHVKLGELKFVRDFMGRFDRHIKMSWGYGTDESLSPDQEIKFTIIATGFGLDAVPEIREKMDENKLLEIQRENEERQKNENRVRDFYSDRGKSSIKVNRVLQSSIIVLTQDELDDDSLITFMENNPTYNRDPKEIEKIRKPVKSSVQKEESATNTLLSDETAGGTTIIKF